MVRPIHSEGVTHHAPRVHFSPVVSQLRYKEQQGSLRPSKRTPTRNSDNTKVLNGCNISQQNNDNGQEQSAQGGINSGGRVTVHVQEIIVPYPTVQKVEVQKSSGGGGGSCSVNSELTSSARKNNNKESSTPLVNNINKISQRVNVPSSSSSSVPTTTSTMETPVNNDSHFDNLAPPLLQPRNNNNKLLLPNGLARIQEHVAIDCPDVTTCQAAATDLTGSDLTNIRNTRTAYGYEYYGFTYGLPSPPLPPRAPQQRSSVPNNGSFNRDIYNNLAQSRFSCSSSCSCSASSAQFPPAQRLRDVGMNFAVNSVNNAESGSGRTPTPSSSSLSSSACHQTKSGGYYRTIKSEKLSGKSKLEGSGISVGVDDKVCKKSRKFNLLRKLSFGKLGGRDSAGGGECKSKKSVKRATSSSNCSKKVVSLSSWPSIRRGVVVSHNNRESFSDSPIPQSTTTSCSTCVELCQGKKARNPAIPATQAHLSSPSQHREDTSRSHFSSNASRVVVHPTAYFQAKDNCLCIQGMNDCFSGNDDQTLPETLDCNNSLKGQGSLPTWNQTTYDPTYVRRHLHHRGQLERQTDEKVASGDGSLLQITNFTCDSSGIIEEECSGNIVDGVFSAIRNDYVNNVCVVTDDACNKNAATSPIHHLSAFHALNLPVVVSSVSKCTSIPEDPAAPTPPPRPHKKKTDASIIREELLCKQVEDINSVSSTDELSANVDRILDEIANLELECLSMELYESLKKKNGEEEEVDEARRHLRDGGDRERSKIESFSSTKAERDRMECGDEGPTQTGGRFSGQQLRRSGGGSLFGKPPLPPSRRNTSVIRQQFLQPQREGGDSAGKLAVEMSGTRSSSVVGAPPPTPTTADLDVKLLKFRLQLYRSREELAKSHPNLEEMEELVRSSMVIDRSRSQRTLPLSVYDGSSSRSSCNRTGKPEISPAATAHVPTTTTTTAGQFSLLTTRLTPDPVTSEKERSRAQEWNKLVQQVVSKNLRSKSSGNHHNGNAPGQIQCSAIVETDLDTGASREVIAGRTSERQLYFQTYGEQYKQNDEWNGGGDGGQADEDQDDDESSSKPRWKNNLPLSVFPDQDGHLCYSLNNSQKKTRSMLNLGSPNHTASAGTNMSKHREKSATLTPSSSAAVAEGVSLSVSSSDERARSMEFLLDDSDKNAHLRPPENNLMMRQENRQLSEHEVRIQRSLNKLNVPDWYKKYAEPGSGGGQSDAAGTTTATTSGSKSKIFGSGTGLAGGWTGLSSSKTSSLTSLQSTGRYSGRTHFSSRLRSTGTASTGGRSSRESLMSPSSTASASPSPYYERSSFTYGMPYALTRFASARMSCGASPASLSPSPSPVGGTGGGGSSTSTPVSSAPLSRHHSYSKTPYLGWRSQERLNTKQLYRSPAERLAADLLAQKSRTSSPTTTISDCSGGSKDGEKKERILDTPSKESSPKKETASASDLSLNNSEESNSHKLNRVRSSIKAVSNAIVDYVNESKPLDDGMNGGTSPRRGFVWLESSFVGTKPIDSPGTPDTPTVIMTSSRQLPGTESGSSSSIGGSSGRPRNVFRFEDDHPSSLSRTGASSSTTATLTGAAAASAVVSPSSASSSAHNNDSSSAKNNGTTAAYNPYHSRNEQMEERSNSSSVSSPTLDDILDSLLALRRPHKKIKPIRGHSREPVPLPPSQLDPTPVSDWQERMNQPVLDTLYFPVTDDFFPGSTTTTTVVQSSFSSSANNDYNFSSNNNSSTGTSNAYDFESNNARSGVETTGQARRTDDNNESSSNYISNTTYSYGDTSSSQAAAHSSDLQNRSRRELEKNGADGVGGDSKAGETDEVDAVDENAFGIPTEIYTATAAASSSSYSSAAVNAIASLNDSNPPTPGRHRRVSFDLDISDKEEKSSSRSHRKDESVGGSIHCRNSKCTKTASGLEARREFKTCHNCNAYYCSRECRRAHWEKHKKVCMQSRVGALCKQIINHVKEDSFVVSQLSSVARRGYLAKGRGCVKLFFSSPDRAERFLTGGLPELPEPWYIPSGDILPEEMGAQTFAELSDQCRTYNGDNRFVLYVSVCVVNEVPTSGAVKWEREMISRSAKLRLLLPRNYEENQMHHQAASPAHLFPEEPHIPAVSPESSTSENVPPPPPPHGSDNDTLILRSVPAPTTRQLNRSEDKKLREVSFANIQKHLIERGVDLKRTFPDIYHKLCNYVEYDEPFLPVTIYPKNNNTGHQFVCVIMPDPSSNHHAHEDYKSASSGTSTSGNRTFETVNISENSYDFN